MNKKTKHFYEFGEFRLDLNERLLLRQEKLVALTPKAFETLLVLVENSGRIVEKDFLMSRIWPDTFVEEVSLARNVSSLRKALGGSDSDIQYIETFPKRGYRFVAPVSEYKEEETVRQASPVIEARPPVEESLAASLTEEVEQGFDAKVVGSAQAQADKLALLEALWQPESPMPGEAITDSDAVAVKTEAATASDQSLERLSDRSNFVSFLNRHKSAALIALVALVIGVVTTAYVLRSSRQTVPPFQEMKIIALTNTGRASNGAISPDGKYVAYVRQQDSQQSIWVKHIATDSETQIVPPGDYNYSGLIFSRDGNYIYYVKRTSKVEGIGDLYQSPILGKESKKVIENILLNIAISPDGNRIAFIRATLKGLNIEESSLIIANTDGTGEQILATRSSPELFKGNLAWSPTSKSIACVVSNYPRETFLKIVEVRLEDGSEKPISSQKWTDIGRIAWLSDGNSLLLSAQDQASSSSDQIWLLSYANGEARKITNDLASYGGVSVTADSNSLVSRQLAIFYNIWVVPYSDPSQSKQITSGENFQNDLSWTPDGRIVFSTDVNGSESIWIMEANGAEKRKLTGDLPINDSVRVTSDGRYIVFVSGQRGSKNIWRMDIDGSNPRQLTNETGNLIPQLSPDRESVFYYHLDQARLRKISINGSEPVQLDYQVPNIYALSITFSLDGKLAAYFYKDAPNSQRRIAILPIEGGQPVKTLDIPPITGPNIMRWTPDGQALAYINNDQAGVSNIWLQPLSGGPPRQLTNFNSERILYFDWSRDGKNLACIRGYSTTNIVLISNFK